MGLDINAVQFLIAAKKQGMDFGEVCMLGRQGLNVYPATMVRALRAHGFNAEAFQRETPDLYFAEPFFRALGAREVYSLDASGYESASFVHDLNLPIEAALKERFDIVYDGGTLEHVFDFPVAIRNCMEMVRPGGHLILHTVANNYCGHGFYQFSPELFYRVLCPANGYRLERMVIHPVGPYGKWREVADPEAIRQRVELINFCPVQLLVLARRVRAVPVLQKAPVQSDYASMWKASSSGVSNSENQQPASTPAFAPSHRQAARWFPSLARLWNVFKMGRELYRSHSIRNRRSFRPVKRP